MTETLTPDQWVQKLAELQQQRDELKTRYAHVIARLDQTQTPQDLPQ